MRLVIDLQSCQVGDELVAASSLALVRAIADGAGTHEVWVALNGQFAETIEPLRQALSSSLPLENIKVFQLPGLTADQARSWRRSACELIRDSFLADLGADLVFVPDALLANAVCAAVPASTRYSTVLQLSASVLVPTPEGDNPDQFERYHRQQALLCSVAQVLRTADPAWDAGRLWDLFGSVVAAQNLPIPTPRPRLAYVSPLAPERSGISDYSAELLPELARRYEIDLVVEQDVVSDPWIRANLPLRSVAWFEAHADEYERVLYHVGNSPAHKHMLALMARHPGIVVLHDFYVGNVLQYLEVEGGCPGAFLQALHASHGWAAMLDRKAIGLVDAVWKYPCNKPVIDQADGVIVHSNFSRELAEQWYGPGVSNTWCTLPLLRGRVFPTNRRSARTSLGLDDNDFLVCSFGMLGPTKLNTSLLTAWLDTPMAGNANCRLVFVGQNDNGKYGRELQHAIDRSAAAGRITITGFVTQKLYHTYLCACDCAVQLRNQTRGETSAAVLDALLNGAPTIANAHGAIAELPDSVMLKLADQFSTAELSEALIQLWQEPQLRATLSRTARCHVAEGHSPERVGAMYCDAIENFVATSPKRNYRRLIDSLGRISSPKPPIEQDLIQTAAAIAANRLRPKPRQMFVDISALVQTDLKTGIQRVVRSILTALLKSPSACYRIEPVYTIGRGAPYRYARHYMQQEIGLAAPALADEPIEVSQGDLFLGLDLFTSGTHQSQDLLQDFRNRGVRIHFIVFDILPALHPNWFPKEAVAEFKKWLLTVTLVSDGLICISRSVAFEVFAWASKHQPSRHTPLKIGYFHLGADMEASAPSRGLAPDVDHLLALIQCRPCILCVSTIEPRKGYFQALSAFELLWSEGVEVNFVIVGKRGWMVDELITRIDNHPQKGKRLFWLPDVSDEMLGRLYALSTGLLAASEGEGFGLPMVEAARQGLPIIARDLPVFREVMGGHAYYFAGLTDAVLARSLKDWLLLWRENRHPTPHDFEWLTWAESASQLLSTIETEQWCHILLGQAASTRCSPTES